MANANTEFSLKPEVAASKLSALNATFKSLVKSVNDMVTDLGDLQRAFYSPNGVDTTLIYEECAKNIGVGSSQGLEPSIKNAHLWCSAVDQYVQRKEYEAKNSNPYDN